MVRNKQKDYELLWNISPPIMPLNTGLTDEEEIWNVYSNLLFFLLYVPCHYRTWETIVNYFPNNLISLKIFYFHGIAGKPSLNVNFVLHSVVKWHDEK